MHRRQFLGRAGTAVSVAVLGACYARFAAAAESSAPSLEQKLAAFALSLRYEDLPAEVVAAVKRSVIDTLACAFGAVGSEAATIAESTIRSSFGTGQAATVIGNPRRASIEGAVFVNGVLVRSLDLNDTYLGTEPLHPSELFPTALAIGEDGRHSGRDFITALAVGYEASMRITDAVSFMQRGFHPLCSAAYAAPLIAGRLWGLKAPALANAVGLSAARGYTSFVINSGAISMMKAMGFGAGAVDALFMTRLAANGFTGPTGTLEWFAARANPGPAQGQAPSPVVVDLDPGHYRLPKVSLKRFPIQIELAAVAEAGSLLAPRIRGRGPQVRAITVETYPGIIERVADAAKFNPQTRGTADHSLPVCLAMALLDGDVTLAQFDRDRWRDRDVTELVQKTTVKQSASLMAKLPRGRGASVEVALADGSTLRETVEVPEGDPQRPLSWASLQSKFTKAAVPVIGAERAQKVLSQIDTLETLMDIGDLARSLTRYA
jgi:2-methylcitrate dehydratase